MVALLCVSNFFIFSFADTLEPSAILSSHLCDYGSVDTWWNKSSDFYLQYALNQLSVNSSDYNFVVLTTQGNYSSNQDDMIYIFGFDKSKEYANVSQFSFSSSSSFIYFSNADIGCSFHYWSGYSSEFYSFSSGFSTLQYDYSSTGRWNCDSQIPIYFKDEPVISSKTSFDLNVDYDKDYNCNISVTTNDKEEYLVGFGLVNPDYSHIEYSFFESDGRYFLSSSQSVNVSFNAKDFYDTCQDYSNYSDNLTIVATIYKPIDNDTLEVFKLLTKEININEILEQDNGLFSEKKDYIPLPSLDDYVEDFPDFPEWDGEHPIDSIWNIVKWVGECLVIVGKNLIGFFKWLGTCIWVIIQNIGIALYNLVVDLRRLVIYLFVPSQSEINDVIEKKTPSLSYILSSIETGKNSEYDGLHFNFLGKDFSLNPSKILSSDLCLTIRNATTIIFLALQVLIPIRKIYRIFGIVNGSDDISLGGSEN